jgi:hypothetical protein
VDAGRFVLRLFLVPIGLALAVLSGVGVGAFALQRSGAFLAPGEPAEPMLDMIWIAFPVLAAAGPLLFGAGLAAAIVAEALSIRSWIFYALAGAAVAFFAARFFGLTDDPQFLSSEAIVGAGFAAGLVYWVVAGRNAGLVER